MTTTTPESRARIAYTAYCRGLHGHHGEPIPPTRPTFDELPSDENAGWMKASEVLWDLATTGRALL